MLDKLSERLQSTFSNLQGGKQITLENIETAIKDVRRALLEADVSLRVVKTIITRVQEEAQGQDILKSISPSQQLIKIVHDEMVKVLGAENHPLTISGNPPLIVLFGLQGAGKTTTAAKLALYLRKKQKANPLLIAADVYRPAAIEQLLTLGKQINIEAFTLKDSTNILDITKAGIEYAKANNLSPVIIDTAGRLQVDTEMMAELLLLERTFKPAEKLLVVDAMMGQEAINVAETFNTQLDVTGLILTKLDGDSRGGAALSLVEVTGRPIKFIGTSEKPDGLEAFYPDRLATRILGMGDVLSLVERAQDAFDAEEALALEKKMRKAEFTLEDFMKIQGMMNKIGSLDQILGMLPIPGLTKDIKDMLAHGGQKEMGKVQVIISSMTIEERRNPELIKGSRVKRIARGSGRAEEDIQQFLKQFEMMRQVMKQFMGGMPNPATGGKPGKAGNNLMLNLYKKQRPQFPFR